MTRTTASVDIMPGMEDQDSYSVREASRLLGHTPRHIRLLADQGQLEGRKDESGNWRLDRASVHARLKEQRQRQELEAEPEPETLRERELEAELKETLYKLGRAEARAELTEQAHSSLEAERDRLLADAQRERERAEKLEAELQEERTKGFWRRLFGG